MSEILIKVKRLVRAIAACGLSHSFVQCSSELKEKRKENRHLETVNMNQEEWNNSKRLSVVFFLHRNETRKFLRPLNCFNLEACFREIYFPRYLSRNIVVHLNCYYDKVCILILSTSQNGLKCVTVACHHLKNSFH